MLTMEVVANNFMPGDSRLVEQLVYELKSQGIFDRFRKECISDVDTKPAYQNLRQRVEGSVSTFLRQQTWNPDMNKNQVREQLRKNIHESGYLETGVERIVDQVVNPKINTIFLPEVEDVVYRFLGVVKPVRDIKKEVKINIADLLPTDLEAVSPESVQSFKDDVKPEDHIEALNDSLNSSSKPDEDESPPFEPLDPANKITNEENSVDSHLSGFSGLQSHGSNHSGDNRVCQMEISSQDSQISHNSSESRLSIITSEDTTKMDICDDSSSNLMKSITYKTSTETSIQTKMDVDEIMPCDEMDHTGDVSMEESLSSGVNRKDNESSSDNNLADKTENEQCGDRKSEMTDENKGDKEPDKSIDKKPKSSDRYSKDKRDDKHRKSSSSSSKDISSSRHSSSKDRVRNRKDSKSSSSTRDKEKTDKNREKIDRDKDKKGKDKTEKGITDKEKERDVDKSSKDKDKTSGRDKEKSEKPKDKSEREKLDKDKVKIEKSTRDKEKSTRDKERDNSDKEKERSEKEKERSHKEKERFDKDTERSDKEKERSDKEKERSNKEKERPDREKERSDKEKERSDREKERSDKEKDKVHRERDKSDRERSSKDKDKSSKHREKSDKDKNDKHKEKYREKDKYYKEKSSKEKETSDKEKSSDSKTSSKDKSDRPSSSSKKDNADKDKSHSSHSSSSRDKSKSDNGETKSRSSTDKSRKDSKHSVNGKSSGSSSDAKKDTDKKRDSKKQLKDDHYSSKDKKNDRRSTDRDSNDGHSGKPSFSGSCSGNTSSRSEKSSQDFTSNSGDSGNSDQVEQSEPTRSEEPAPVYRDVQRLILPKFASNFQEIRKIMKIRKQLALLEKQKRLGFTHIESQVLVENGLLPGKGKAHRPAKPKNATKQKMLPVAGKENVLEKNDIEENVRLGESLELICEEVVEVDIVGPEDAVISLEQSTGEIRMETPESPWDSTSMRSTELSQENWEALEARLAQEMSAVNYNSYESDEELILSASPQREETVGASETMADAAVFEGSDSESSSNELEDFRGFPKEEGTCRSLELLRSLISECIRRNQALANEHFGQEKRHEVEREANSANKDNKQLSVVIDKDNCRLELVADACRFLEKPTAFEKENLRFLRELIGKLEEDLLVRMEGRGSVQPVKRGRKRKLEEIVDVKNNNRDHYEQIIVRKRGRPPGSHTVLSKVNKEKMCNTTDLLTHEKFSLPLSPAESDKSNDKKEEELLIPQKRRRTIATQRYSSDDLYKPRPVFCRRNKDARKSRN